MYKYMSEEDDEKIISFLGENKTKAPAAIPFSLWAQFVSPSE